MKKEWDSWMKFGAVEVLTPEQSSSFAWWRSSHRNALGPRTRLASQDFLRQSKEVGKSEAQI